jgi:hypothetical protein
MIPGFDIFARELKTQSDVMHFGVYRANARKRQGSLLYPQSYKKETYYFVDFEII